MKGNLYIVYRRTGTREPVFLTHGEATNSFIERRVIPFLQSNYEIITIDLLGCKGPVKPLQIDYTINHQAKLFGVFFAEIDLPKLRLLDHDIGDGIAPIVNVTAQYTFLDSVPFNTIGYDYWPVHSIMAMRTQITRQFALATLDWGILKLVVKRRLYYRAPFPEGLLEHFIEGLHTLKKRKAFLYLARCLDNNQFMFIIPKLKPLQIPVLIIRSETDENLPLDISDHLATELPHSASVKINTGEHFLQEDEPELLSQSLHSFFQQNRHDD